MFTQEVYLKYQLFKLITKPIILDDYKRLNTLKNTDLTTYNVYKVTNY